MPGDGAGRPRLGRGDHRRHGRAATAQTAADTSDAVQPHDRARDRHQPEHGGRPDHRGEEGRPRLPRTPCPHNVEVGIVTFDNTVVVRQQPSLDRAAARQVINGLTLKLNTALYKGVQTAISTTGKAGQRQVLVLSDGKDNTKAPLAAGDRRDQEQRASRSTWCRWSRASRPAPLTQMATAGGGTVISAPNPDALSAAFSSEADVLARQVLVTADRPGHPDRDRRHREVSLDAGPADRTPRPHSSAWQTPHRRRPTPTTDPFTAVAGHLQRVLHPPAGDVRRRRAPSAWASSAWSSP